MDSDEERDLIRAADAFMQRLRPPADEDVPVLTEIVEANALRPPLSDDAREALVGELESWLDLHLPAAVLRVLDGVADQLIAQVAQDARKDLLPQLLSILENRRQRAP